MPASAPGSARARSHASASTPPSAAATSAKGPRISPIRRGMYSGTFPIPVSRCSVSAVCLVLVSDHSGFPVTSQSLATHTIGAAAASSASRASWPEVRAASTDARGASAAAPGRPRERGVPATAPR